MKLVKNSRLVALALMSCLAVGANAQQFGSFWKMTSINGITVTRTGLTYDVALSSNAANNYVTFFDYINNVARTEYFTQVMGFYKVGDGVNNIGPAGGYATGSNTTTNGGTWKWTDDQGKLAGWGAQGNTPPRLNLGDTGSFTFGSLLGGVAGPPSWIRDGFHLVFVNNLVFPGGTVGGNANTYYVTTGVGAPPAGNPVPEPFTMGLGLAGASVFVRRRMKAKKS